MSKLQYKTKPPRKGYVFNQSNMTHVSSDYVYDKLPPDDIQQKAMDLVNNTMQSLIQKLSDLGYDQTKAGFYIHWKG